MNHYYTNNDNLATNIRNTDYTFRGNRLVFETDNGVFSKERIDFGTNVLLNSLPVFPDNSTVLDVGCGYGIIGLSIAKSNDSYFVDMVDVNDRAIKLSKQNASKNNVKNCNIFASYIYENVTKTYDYIISNPPIRAGKEVVHTIILDAINHLNEGGKVLCVIQKKQGAESLMKRMNEVFGNIEILKKDKGYFILESKK